MKKISLIALLILFAVNTTIAQESRFGVKAGVNFASLSGDAVDELDGRTGFHIGAVGEFMLSEKFALQPELVYSQQGATEDFEGFDSKLKLDYLNIPLMGKYYVGEDLALEFGPQIGFLMNAKADFDGDEEDIKDSVKGTDISLGGGISYNMETGWFAQARYMFGVSDVNDEDGVGEVKNNVLSISIGYMF